ncbi:hypothetical protein [Alistipes megaguti]|uniref:hypothetical protein n=1 Tax=Alistipes megaguti TaxID=2364787 RepID=UPI002356CEEB|nr:hypothetical protein [Alistipes megaguti]
MKHTVITALLLAALPLANGCSDNSEVFYSISYPIVRIEAQVTVTESEPTPEEPSTGEGTETGGNDGTGSGTGTDGTETGTGGTGTGTGSGSGSDTGTGEGEGTEEPVDPLVAQIQAEVLAEAPVQVGGRYVLDFTRYNRGPLTVDTASEAGTVQGAFFKEPGASEINLFFLEDNYACTISSYRDTDGKYKVLLTVDLTEIYQQRYPSAGLTKVVRQEYTSTPSN